MDMLIRFLMSVGFLATMALGFFLFASFGLIAVIVIGILVLWTKFRERSPSPSFCRMRAFPRDNGPESDADATDGGKDTIDVEYEDVTGRK